MAETRRAVQQSTPVTVTLMQFGKSSAMLKEHGEKAVEAAMQKIGQLFAANIRQNDLAFRYENTTIALVLGETGEKEALMAVEKLRKLLAEVKLSDEIIPFSAGLAEAVVRQQFDPVDIVTEVINRADKALDAAVAQGMGRIVSLAPSVPPLQLRKVVWRRAPRSVAIEPNHVCFTLTASRAKVDKAAGKSAPPHTYGRDCIPADKLNSLQNVETNLISKSTRKSKC